MTSDAPKSGSPIRRIVTGERPDGASVLVSDEVVDAIQVPLLPGAQFFSLWGSDAAPTLPNAGGEPDFSKWFPPPGGFRFQMIVLPPAGAEADPNLDMKQALRETEAKLPGMITKMDPKDPGMHQTDSIDLIFVTSGACELELGDGTKVPVGTGEAVVQNGPRMPGAIPMTSPAAC
ncbi:hypothetical protein A7A08_02571 [Methyloligella halotolerans]|uniref:Cupin domain protein n=1 Tax=Methyloligella halotolerans TaxID=1177755 RepID=A0A1E2RWH8_9HYPH|nr:hypothetical protein [Methyloligella halotolerans]ODA66448.1 hypothetical protein A7A08_02571 [Methyloligella halotolerans]